MTGFRFRFGDFPPSHVAIMTGKCLTKRLHRSRSNYAKKCSRVAFTRLL